MFGARREDQRTCGQRIARSAQEPGSTLSRAAGLRVRPRQDSNLRSRLRRAVLYPLSYGGSAWQHALHSAWQSVGHDGLLDPNVNAKGG